MRSRRSWRSALGAKTARLAFADGDIRPALLGATRSERSETEALVRQIHPGYVVEPIDESTLFDDIYPSGEEQAARAAAYARALRAMGPPRRFRMGPDGRMQEVSLESF